MTPQIYLPDTSSAVTRVNPEQAFAPLSRATSVGVLSSMLSMDAFHQMPAQSSIYEDQYDVVAGHWPAGSHELVLVLDEDGTMPDLFEYTLSLREHGQLDQLMRDYFAGQGAGIAAVPGTGPTASPTAPAAPTSAAPTPTDSATPSAPTSYTYERLMQVTFKLVPASARYQYDDAYGVWTDRSEDTAFMQRAVAAGEDLRITEIGRAHV